MGVRRCPALLFVLGLIVAACGDDVEGGSPTSGVTVAPTTPTATTTTAPWGETVAPGADDMLSATNLLLREDFQDGDIGDWNVQSGWYLLSAGSRRLLAAGGAAWVRFDGGSDWARYAARFGVLIHHGSIGLTVAMGADGRYVVHLTETGVYLLRDVPFGTFATLGSAQPIPPGEAHAVAVGVDGGHLQVYLDGRLLIDAVDPNPLPGGAVGLGTVSGSSVQVDNILVAALRGPLPDLQVVGDSADAAPAPESVDSGPVQPVDTDGFNLELTGVTYPERIDTGDTFDVAFTIANTGTRSVGSFTVAWLSAGDRCETSTEGMAPASVIELGCRAPAYAASGDYEWTAAADSTGMIDEGEQEDDNLAAGTVTIGSPAVEVATDPNLVVSWFDLDPPFPAPGEPVDFRFGVVQTESRWNGGLPAYELRLVADDDTVACIASIPAGDTSGVCTLPALGAEGEYRFRMELDALDAVEESNERDNTGLITITVSATAEARPNLLPTAVAFDPDPPRSGAPSLATLWVETQPFTTGLPFYTLTLEIDEVLVCTFETNMGSGGAMCDVPALAPGQHTYRFLVDAGDAVAEPTEDDNEYWGRFTANP